MKLKQPIAKLKKNEQTMAYPTSKKTKKPAAKKTTKGFPKTAHDKKLEKELIANGFIPWGYMRNGKPVVSVYDPYRGFKLLGHYKSYDEAYNACC